jgi:anti-sigma B factor antagonist
VLVEAPAERTPAKASASRGSRIADPAPHRGETTVLARPETRCPLDEPPYLTVTVEWSCATVVLHGELDRDCAHHLVDALAALAGTDQPCWVVDAAAVTWCDAGGLRALAAAHALAVARGRRLQLVGANRCVDRLVRLSGLDRLMADTLPGGPDTPVACDV